MPFGCHDPRLLLLLWPVPASLLLSRDHPFITGAAELWGGDLPLPASGPGSQVPPGQHAGPAAATSTVSRVSADLEPSSKGGVAGGQVGQAPSVPASKPARSAPGYAQQQPDLEPPNTLGQDADDDGDVFPGSGSQVPGQAGPRTAGPVRTLRRRALQGRSFGAGEAPPSGKTQ